MLCKAVENVLNLGWSRRNMKSSSTTGHVEEDGQPEQGVGDDGSRGHRPSCQRDGLEAEAASLGGDRGVEMIAGGVKRAAMRRAIKGICETTQVSAGLAAYVLRVSKDQAYLRLSEDNSRPTLETGFREFTELL
ncbi:unnamed protein product, partial [Ectocarpus sp. 8 AP-2014]